MDAHYRVAIFGSARIKEGDIEYNNVYSIAKGLAESGFDIVTGGGRVSCRQLMPGIRVPGQIRIQLD